MKRQVKRSLKRDVKRRVKRRFTRQGDFRVYILECSDGSYYTGHTNDLAARLKLHRSGKGSRYVRSRLPVKLVYKKKYRYFKLAFFEELRVKRLSRLDKESLVKKYRRDQRKNRGRDDKR